MQLIKSFLINKDLIYQLSLKEINTKYKGSYLGCLWLFITPFAMLTVYTFVFSVIFKAKWNIATDQSGVQFALILFCGLIIFNLFSECIIQAPSLINTHVNYVKKVSFPLEILPVSVLISALFHFMINFLILLIAVTIFISVPSIHILLLPLIIFPLCLFTLGISWFLASLGVFMKDLFYGITILVQLLFFMTPIFYPVSAVPEKFQAIIRLNILAVFVESARKIIIFGEGFNWGLWFIALVFSVIVFYSGYWCFIKTKNIFGDVI